MEEDTSYYISALTDDGEYRQFDEENAPFLPPQISHHPPPRLLYPSTYPSHEEIQIDVIKRKLFELNQRMIEINVGMENFGHNQEKLKNALVLHFKANHDKIIEIISDINPHINVLLLSCY
jgi:hypothetical protein